jgi:hypothetical protein
MPTLEPTRTTSTDMRRTTDPHDRKDPMRADDRLLQNTGGHPAQKLRALVADADSVAEIN